MDLQGRYRLDRVVGVGGTAEVWRGVDLVLHRPVAVRLLRWERREEHRAFVTAGRVAARLGHPGAAAVYDVGVADLAGRGPTPYVVMEFADGPTLARRLNGGHLPWPEAVRVGADVAAVMRDAHAQWVYHGRLEPTKILLTGVGAKVIGFGADMSDDHDAAVRDVRSLGSMLSRCLGNGTGMRAPGELWAFVDLLKHADSDSRPTAAEAASVLRSFADAAAELPAAVRPRAAVEPRGTASRGRTRWTVRTVVASSGVVALLLVGAAALGQAGAAGLPWFTHPPEVAVMPPDSDPCADADTGAQQCTPTAAPSRHAPTTAVPRSRSSTPAPKLAASRPPPSADATPSRPPTASASPSRTAVPSASASLSLSPPSSAPLSAAPSASLEPAVPASADAV